MTTRINGKTIMRIDIRRREMRQCVGNGNKFGSGAGFLKTAEDYLTPIEQLWDRCHALPTDDYEGRCAVLREMRKAMQR